MNVYLILKALCDENRIKLLQLIANQELCACDLIENLPLTQPTISHHLKILTDSKLVNVEKRGKWCFYSINRDAFNEFYAALDKEIFQQDVEVRQCNSSCDGHRKNN